MGAPELPSQTAIVRPAEPSDCRQIAGVYVRAWRAAYQHVFPAEMLDGISVDEREALLRRLVAGDSQAVWVAERADVPVGFASAGPSRTERDAGELYEIYLVPEAWGSGAGKRLMAAATAWFADVDYPTAMLWVVGDNPRARRFYEREGWKAEGTRVNTVLGIDVEEALYRLTPGR